MDQDHANAEYVFDIKITLPLVVKFLIKTNVTSRRIYLDLKNIIIPYSSYKTAPPDDFELH